MQSFYNFHLLRYRSLLLTAAALMMLGTAMGQHYKNVNASLFAHSKIKPGLRQLVSFTLYLSNTDYEYGDSLALEFSEGLVPLTSPNDPLTTTSEGQPPAALNPSSGRVISWGRQQPGTIGGIETLKTIKFTVDLKADDVLPDTIWVRYFVSGDGMPFTSGTGTPKDAEDTLLLEEVPEQADLQVNFQRPISEMYQYPLHQLGPLPMVTEVVNNGGPMEDFSVLVYEDLAAGLYMTFQVPPMNSGDTLEFKPEFNFEAYPNQDYDIKIYLNNPNDLNPDDNTTRFQFATRDTVLSRAGETADSALSLGGTGIIGTWFSLVEADTVSSFSVYLDDPDRGDSLRIVLYHFDSVPSGLIQTTEVFKITSIIVLPGWYTINLQDTVVLDSGKFFVGIEQLMESRLGISTSKFNYFPNSNFIRKTGSPAWVPAASVDPLYETNLMLKVNFGSPPTPGSVGLQEPERTKLIGPNPVGDLLFLPAQGSFVISDLSGRVVLSGKTDTGAVDVSHLPKGMYLLKYSDKSTRFIRQ